MSVVNKRLHGHYKVHNRRYAFYIATPYIGIVRFVKINFIIIIILMEEYLTKKAMMPEILSARRIHDE